MNAKEKIECFCGDYIASIVQASEGDECLVDETHRIQFSSNTYSAKKITSQFLSIAALVIELLHGNRTISLRDVYYSLKYLFDSQDECNERIITLGSMLQLKRHEMNIIPASKGLLGGKLRYRFHAAVTNDDTPSAWVEVHELTTSGGVAVSHLWASRGDEGTEIEVSDDVRCILVIEKEGIFHRLCEDKFHIRYPCVLVCGCGFPDIATRALVSMLSRKFPALPVVGLCDYNPFGLALLMTYRFATVGSAFEGSGHETPSLRWLGLRRSHVLKLKSTGNMKSASQSSPSDCRVSESSVTDNTIIPSKSGLCDDMLSIQTNKGLSSKRKYDDKSTVVCLNTRDTFVMAHFQTDTMMQPLSVTDHRKIKSMLTSKMFKALPREYSAELVNMKNGGVKCELETLYSMGLDYLSDFLEYALLTKDYI